MNSPDDLKAIEKLAKEKPSVFQSWKNKFKKLCHIANSSEKSFHHYANFFNFVSEAEASEVPGCDVTAVDAATDELRKAAGLEPRAVKVGENRVVSIKRTNGDDLDATIVTVGEDKVRVRFVADGKVNYKEVPRANLKPPLNPRGEGLKEEIIAQLQKDGAVSPANREVTITTSKGMTLKVEIVGVEDGKIQARGISYADVGSNEFKPLPNNQTHVPLSDGQIASMHRTNPLTPPESVVAKVDSTVPVSHPPAEVIHPKVEAPVTSHVEPKAEVKVATHADASQAEASGIEVSTADSSVSAVQPKTPAAEAVHPEVNPVAATNPVPKVDFAQIQNLSSNERIGILRRFSEKPLKIEGRIGKMSPRDRKFFENGPVRLVGDKMNGGAYTNGGNSIDLGKINPFYTFEDEAGKQVSVQLDEIDSIRSTVKPSAAARVEPVLAQPKPVVAAAQPKVENPLPHGEGVKPNIEVAKPISREAVPSESSGIKVSTADQPPSVATQRAPANDVPHAAPKPAEHYYGEEDLFLWRKQQQKAAMEVTGGELGKIPYRDQPAVSFDIPNGDGTFTLIKGKMTEVDPSGDWVMVDGKKITLSGQQRGMTFHKYNESGEIVNSATFKPKTDYGTPPPSLAKPVVPLKRPAFVQVRNLTDDERIHVFERFSGKPLKIRGQIGRMSPRDRAFLEQNNVKIVGSKMNGGAYTNGGRALDLGKIDEFMILENATGQQISVQLDEIDTIQSIVQ